MSDSEKPDTDAVRLVEAALDRLEVLEREGRIWPMGDRDVVLASDQMLAALRELFKGALKTAHVPYTPYWGFVSPYTTMLAVSVLAPVEKD